MTYKTACCLLALHWVPQCLAVDCRQSTLQVRFTEQVMVETQKVKAQALTSFFKSSCSPAATVAEVCPVDYSSLYDDQSYVDACTKSLGQVVTSNEILVCQVKGYCKPTDGCGPNVRYEVTNIPDCVYNDPSCKDQATTSNLDVIQANLESLGYVCSATSIKRRSFLAGAIGVLVFFLF